MVTDTQGSGGGKRGLAALALYVLAGALLLGVAGATGLYLTRR